MQELKKAKDEGDIKKAEGIQKYINGLTDKLSKIEGISLSNKILGDINALSVLKEDIAKLYIRLKDNESLFEDLIYKSDKKDEDEDGVYVVYKVKVD